MYDSVGYGFPVPQIWGQTKNQRPRGRTVRQALFKFRTMPTGKVYTTEEDLALCRAFFRVSEDSVKGTNRKRSDLEAVLECETANILMQQGFSSFDRTGKALLKRYKQIATEVTNWISAKNL